MRTGTIIFLDLMQTTPFALLPSVKAGCEPNKHEHDMQARSWYSMADKRTC
jgi:hypothetical protein